MDRGDLARKFFQALVEDLLTFAEHDFRQAILLPDGASVGDHAASAARQFAKLGIKPKVAPQIEGPPFPRELGYLWQMFCEIVMGLPSGGFGPSPVSWGTLRAWSEFMGAELAPWEALALVRLGSLRVGVLSEQLKPKRPAGQT